ncbi:MAG: hypothetical protein AAF889_00030 [Cyanobacteria bacterium P01_D01_bin.73]
MTTSRQGATIAPAPPPAQFSAPASPVPLVSIDAGNAAVKIYDGRSYGLIRALYAPIPDGAPTIQAVKNSPVVEVDGARYHVGQQASYYDTCQVAATGNKTELIRLFVAAGLPTKSKTNQADLVLCHHSHDLVREQITADLTGPFLFRRNGVGYSIDIRSVTVLDELFGSWALCRNQGRLGSGLTLGLDLGCGTVLARLIDANGITVRSLTSDKNGVLRLAYLIAQNSKLSQPLRAHGITHPKVAAILEGLQDGSHSYESTGISWGDWWRPIRDRWFKSFITSTTAEFQAQMGMVDRILVTGGGANLVSDLVAGKPRFMIPDAPHRANCIGNWQWVHAQRLGGAA